MKKKKRIDYTVPSPEDLRNSTESLIYGSAKHMEMKKAKREKGELTINSPMEKYNLEMTVEEYISVKKFLEIRRKLSNQDGRTLLFTVEALQACEKIAEKINALKDEE